MLLRNNQSSRLRERDCETLPRPRDCCEAAMPVSETARRRNLQTARLREYTSSLRAPENLGLTARPPTLQDYEEITKED